MGGRASNSSAAGAWCDCFARQTTPSPPPRTRSSKSWRSSRRQDSKRKAHPWLRSWVEARPSPAPWRRPSPRREEQRCWRRWKTAAPTWSSPGRRASSDPGWARCSRTPWACWVERGVVVRTSRRAAGLQRRSTTRWRWRPTGSHTPEFPRESGRARVELFPGPGGHQPLPRGLMRLPVKLSLLLAAATCFPLLLATAFTLPRGREALRSQLDEIYAQDARALAAEVHRTLVDKLDALTLASSTL